MKSYVNNLLLSLNWPMPKKPQLLPFTATPIAYGQKNQYTPDKDTLASLSPERIKRVQKIIGSLLYYAQAVDNMLLVALNAISARQAKATVHTEQLIDMLLNYVPTYPNNSIVYRASDMVLCTHADAGYLNETWYCSRAGAHIFLLEENPWPRFNGAVLAIVTIIKFVMASAAEAELVALFIATRKMVPHQQTLMDMGWPQPWSLIQTDNSTAVGVTNKTIVPKRSKMMDMRLWWLRCQGSQNQFRYYWNAGSKNWADYSTKHHPNIYDEAHCPTHAGVWNIPWVLPQWQRPFLYIFQTSLLFEN